MLYKLTNVRIRYCDSLFTAKGMKNDPTSTPAHSATFLLDPEADADQIAKIREIAQAVAKAKWTEPKECAQNIALIKAKDRMCLHDGNLKAKSPGFAGMMFVSARAYPGPTGKSPVIVVDRDRTPLKEEDGRPYDGCRVNAVVDIYAQANQYGIGINAELKGVQFVADDEAFGVGAPVSVTVFDDLSATGADNLDDLMGADDAAF